MWTYLCLCSKIILSRKNRLLAHFPRDHSRLAGDSTEKDSRSPPRQPWDPFLGGQNVLKAVRLKENLERGLCLLLDVARLDGHDTCLKAFKNNDQESENREAETCFPHT